MEIGTGSAEDQNKLEKEQIRQFFVRLLPEINLRLFLEQEMAEREVAGQEMVEQEAAGQGIAEQETAAQEPDCAEDKSTAVFCQKFLWVEAIMLTDYQAAPSRKQKHSLRPRITRLWEDLTKNKNKNEKERR